MKPSKLWWSAVGIFGLALGLTFGLGYGPASRSTLSKAELPQGATATATATGTAAGAERPPDKPSGAAPASDRGKTLVVDYRDDVTDAELAATPEVEQPISRFSARDRVYRIELGSEDEARRTLARLRDDPRVESAD